MDLASQLNMILLSWLDLDPGKLGLILARADLA